MEVVYRIGIILVISKFVFMLTQSFVRSVCDTDYTNGYLRCHSSCVIIKSCDCLSVETLGEVPELKRGAATGKKKKSCFSCLFFDVNFAHKRRLLWLPFINTFVYLGCAKCRI